MLSETKPTILTVLVPVYNEEESLESFFASFTSTFPSPIYHLEFLAVNDGSNDKTLEKLLEVRSQNKYSLKIVSLTRNFGRHAAVFAGLDNLGDADYVIVSDADLQNPTNSALEMLSFLKKTNLEIVYGMRPETQRVGFFSKVFWLLLRVASGFKVPRNQTSLLLFNRTFLLKFKALSWRPSFFPAALAAVGARVGYYTVPSVPRLVGRSKYSLWKKIKLFMVSVIDVSLKLSRQSLYRIDRIYG